MEQAPRKIVDLPGGYIIKMYDQVITVGSIELHFGRQVDMGDVHAIRAIFAAGSSSRASRVATAFNLLIQSVNEPVICLEADPMFEGVNFDPR